MEIKVYNDRRSMASAAAQHAIRILRSVLAERGSSRIVAATAASQREFLEHVVQASGINWDRVEAFHLDEYVGLPKTHPGSFRKMFLEQFIDKTGISNYHLLDGDGDLTEVVKQANHAIARAPIDLAFLGIGENGHLAFNDPPANFEIEDPYLVVRLDDACRLQQVGEGWFEGISKVPEQAISMSIRQILKAEELIVVVPGRNKAVAVQSCFQGPVTPMAPASILRTHPRATVYLDRESASLLDSNRLDATIRISQFEGTDR